MQQNYFWLLAAAQKSSDCRKKIALPRYRPLPQLFAHKLATNATFLAASTIPMADFSTILVYEIGTNC